MAAESQVSLRKFDVYADGQCNQLMTQSYLVAEQCERVNSGWFKVPPGSSSFALVSANLLMLHVVRRPQVPTSVPF